MGSTNKIAIVIQRYGKDVVGGAESHARLLAQKLRDFLHYEIEIYTTTAKDYMTWSNEYDAGREEVDGITVYRFPVIFSRAKYFPFFDRVIRKMLRMTNKFKFFARLSELLEWIWIYLQGPVCPQLKRSLMDKQGEYKKIIFFCYLYYPTLVASLGLERKSILIPLAHDEPAFHFGIVQKLFRRFPRMIPNTEPEWEMIKKKLDTQSMPTSHPAGLGFDQRAVISRDEIAQNIKTIADQDRYILYLGRINVGKGVNELINWFCQWREDKNNPSFNLIMAGHCEDSVKIPADSGIHYLGFVSDADRDYLINGCFCLVNPSAYESLSMIVIEALVALKPVLARRECAVFRFYSEFAPAVRLVSNYDEFSREMIRFLNTDRSQINKDLQVSKTWASQRFSWGHILCIFKQQIDN